jgi:glycosyltransferase involved in cell wall biosynthesis
VSADRLFHRQLLSGDRRRHLHDRPLAGGPDGDYEPGPRELPVRSLPNPFYPGYRVPTLRRPSSLPDLDVVHCHGPAPVGLLGRYYAHANDLPAIYTHHTPIEEYFEQSVGREAIAGALSRLYVPLETALLASFDVVTASTARIDRDVEHVPLPVGIDTDFFEPTATDWYPEATVIGYSGRLSLEKHVEHVLQVAERLDEYQFVVVGEGPRRDQLEREAPANVELRDFLPREDLPTFYSSLDAFVTASTGDTLGLSTLEANACGTPVVAADVPPFDQTIGPENGARYAHGDLEAMADAIESCLTDPHPRESGVAVPTRPPAGRRASERSRRRLVAVGRYGRVTVPTCPLRPRPHAAQIDRKSPRRVPSRR